MGLFDPNRWPEPYPMLTSWKRVAIGALVLVAVNVAARLQSEAEPGTVLAGFRTCALVQDRVRAEQREPLVLKDAARPVEAWEILDLVTASP
jgi:class 3 adenylate cyclase